MLDIKLDHHNCKSDAEASFEIIKRLLPHTSRQNLGVQYAEQTDSPDNPKQVPQSRNSKVRGGKSKASTKTRINDSKLLA